jgi:hypothetical protein
MSQYDKTDDSIAENRNTKAHGKNIWEKIGEKTCTWI